MFTQNILEALRVISMELQKLIEELNFCPNNAKKKNQIRDDKALFGLPRNGFNLTLNLNS